MRIPAHAPFLMLLMASGAILAGCASGGGGGAAAPITPVPPVPPTPTSLTLNGPTAIGIADGYSLSTSNTPISAGAAASSAVTVTDPDAASPTRPDQINFSGNETIVAAGQTFTAANFKGVNSTAFGARTVSISQWTTAAALPAYHEGVVITSAVTGFDVYRLNAGLDANGNISNSATAPKYAVAAETTTVGALRTGLQYNADYQVIGLQTPAASMPVSGSATFQGEAYGGAPAYINATAYNSNAPMNGATFLARAKINVDFTGVVTGRIDAPVYASGSGPDFVVDLTARLTGSSFSGGAVETPAGGGPRFAGTFNGAFFGPSTAPAAEVGGAFAIPWTNLMGAFVAGQGGQAPPAVAPLALSGPFATFTAATAAASTVQPAGLGLTVTVTDPDVAAPSSFTQVDFSGNETVRVQASGYDHTFTLADAQGPSQIVSNTAFAPQLTSWQSGANTLIVYQLNVSNIPGYVGVGRFSKYATVAEWGAQAGGAAASPMFNPVSGGFFVMGQETGADLPVTGSAAFTGQAVGRYLAAGADSLPWVGMVNLNANFGATTGAVTGSITGGAYASSGPQFAINFTADRVGARFSSLNAAATGGITATGQVQGGFYGPGAAEAAGVFSLQGAGQALVGGFVAGR